MLHDFDTNEMFVFVHNLHSNEYLQKRRVFDFNRAKKKRFCEAAKIPAKIYKRHNALSRAKTLN